MHLRERVHCVHGSGIATALVPAAHVVVAVLEYEARSTTSGAVPVALSTRTLNRVPAASGNVLATSSEYRPLAVTVSCTVRPTPVSVSSVNLTPVAAADVLATST
jgi:hypothetical protein